MMATEGDVVGAAVAVEGRAVGGASACFLLLPLLSPVASRLSGQPGDARCCSLACARFHLCVNLVLKNNSTNTEK